MTPNKDVIEFYLRRHLRDVEDKLTPVTHESMAKAGVPYDKRQYMLDSYEKNRLATETEIASLEAAIRIVQEYVPSKSS